MTFTDEDLKSLKETTQVFNYLKSIHFDIEALITRLEAAEEVCFYVRRWLVQLSPNTDIDEPLIRWLKSKGEKS